MIDSILKLISVLFNRLDILSSIEVENKRRHRAVHSGSEV